MAEEKEKVEDQPVFSWKAAEFADYQKNGSWFTIIVAAAIVLIAYFVWSKNWTAAGVIFAAALALISVSRAKPKKVSCALYRYGVVVDEKVMRFSDLKSFWVIFGEHPRIRFARTGRFSAPINVPIAEEDPEQIRLFLAKYLPEDENRGEDLTDTISRWMRF